MFSEADRRELLERLVGQARDDPMIESAALVGSAARGTTDRWSDIDLALGLSATAEPERTADRWVGVVAGFDEIADTMDIWAGPTLYRVLLLQSSLQLDLSFWPSGTLAPTGGQALDLLFGTAGPPSPAVEADLRQAVGWGWLYALHTRSAIARGRIWQAAQMLDRLRGQIVTVCCGRRGLETHHGRGVDQLPRSILDGLAATLPPTASDEALTTAFGQALELLAAEVELFDPVLSGRLRVPLEILRNTADAPGP